MVDCLAVNLKNFEKGNYLKYRIGDIKSYPMLRKD